MSNEPNLSAEDDLLSESMSDDLVKAYQQAMRSMEQAEDQLQNTTAEVMNSMVSIREEDLEAETDQEDTSFEDPLFYHVGEIAPDAVVEEVSPSVPLMKLELDEVAGESSPPTLRQVVEAILFVGGELLTAKRLVSILGNRQSSGEIQTTIEDLNRQYDLEKRPYEIMLFEGGYQLHLKEEFEDVRNKTYGLGPKEVKLSQDVIETLALIAYRQPISGTELTEIKKMNVKGILRQLLKRDLIMIDTVPDPIEEEESRKSGKRKGEFVYRTTPRFLELFGLHSLRDLPVTETLDWK